VRCFESGVMKNPILQLKFERSHRRSELAMKYLTTEDAGACKEEFLRCIRNNDLGDNETIHDVAAEFNSRMNGRSLLFV
jgi:hypothetical protein